MRGKVSDTHSLNALSTVPNSSADMKNEATLTTLMLNGYYDMKNQTAFMPYISFGLGLASTRYENTQHSEFEIFGLKQMKFLASNKILTNQDLRGLIN